MKYLKYAGLQGLYLSLFSFMIWAFNASGLWGETFIDRFGWTYGDILIFTVCVNIAMSPVKLSDFDT